MAAGILYITGYAQLTQLAGDAGQMPDENTKTEEQTVAINANPGAATVSAVLDPGTKYVRLNVDTGGPAVCVLFGFGTVGVPPTPAALVTSQRLAQNQTEFKGVPNNGNGSGNNRIQIKISAI